MHPLARSLAPLGLTLLFGVLAAAPAPAQTPRIEAIGPAGVQRGVATDMAITGANLADHPRLLSNLGVGVEILAGSDAKTWRVRLRPDPDSAVGVYVVRVQTDGGVSNPFPIAVDQVATVAEVEENGTITQAQRVAAPVVVEGQVSGSDVDVFRFVGRRGDRVVIDARCARIGSGVDPSLRLLAANRRPIADADDTPGLATDARMIADLPGDGEYLVELTDSRYQGAGPRTNYRLLIGLNLPVAGPVFPLGVRPGATTRFEVAAATLGDPAARTFDLALEGAKAGSLEFGVVPVGLDERVFGAPAPDAEALVATGGWAGRQVEAVPLLVIDPAAEVVEPADPAAPPARALGLPVVLHGRIERPGDTDSFVLPVSPGQKVRIQVQAACLGSLLDATLQVKTRKGRSWRPTTTRRSPCRSALSPPRRVSPPRRRSSCPIPRSRWPCRAT